MVKLHLKAARVNASMTIDEVSEAVGVARSTLIRWEREETFPTAIQLQELAKLYGCEINDFFIPETLT